MILSEITIIESAQLVTMAGVLFMIARGIVTKKDCEKCKAETKADLDSGRKEFREIKDTQADHGGQLAGISSAVSTMEGNVNLLVSHHIGGSNG